MTKYRDILNRIRELEVDKKAAKTKLSQWDRDRMICDQIALLLEPVMFQSIYDTEAMMQVVALNEKYGAIKKENIPEVIYQAYFERLKRKVT